ncbi:putative Holliday junction resolvase [Lactobacillus phage c5]|uniref:Holliday junction resolvase n=1 Tax=Lactobacillus phage c5 TaxID=2892341 RepID=F8J189_9CAUD|nr:RusA-like Holliday junction resolvase [Lactobacillus phage c5]ACA63327.1 putative Holliday junction resolvase [Lactobacillus phage c5]
MKFIINGRLDSLNEYTKACRANRYGANAMKRKNEKKVIEGIKCAGLKKVEEYPLNLYIVWYEPNKRRDIDNITFATKFIQDALVKSGILEDDSQKYIVGVLHRVLVDRKNPRIEVELRTAE